ncbi:MAG: N-acetyl-D-myo-inositol-2-amino-2-deoxy-alpha-D-glucopyranoside deacetylase [Rhodoglobus sp.]|nr:N-acetyl-D-myo-inositol-2-amino-2-deoxy-alpha-D-glucopyranoside deacetylase [Rhodoglobus sp.]
MTERVLFVHAHPDDESISTGSTIATLVDRGATVTVVTCTRGELGEVIPSDLEYLLDSPAALGEYREGELRAALTALGVTDHRMLGEANARWAGLPPRRYLDSGMRWGEHGAEPLDSSDSASLTAAELGEVAADIAAVLIELEPDVVISYDSNGGYGHPDHIRAHQATRTAAEVIGVPFYTIDESPAAKSTLVVPGSDRKRAALAAHRTQVRVEGDTFSLASGDPMPIAAAERFSRLRPATTTFADHSVASRIASSIIALALGAFVGVTLTVAHEATLLVAGVSVPWGIIAAVIITAGLLVGLRVVFDTRIVPACAAIGLIAASALLSLQSPGGTILVAASPIGYAWTFAPVIIGVVVLGWPQRRRAGKAAAPKDKIGSVPAAKGPDPQ